MDYGFFKPKPNKQNISKSIVSIGGPTGTIVDNIGYALFFDDSVFQMLVDPEQLPIIKAILVN